MSVECPLFHEISPQSLIHDPSIFITCHSIRSFKYIVPCDALHATELCVHVYYSAPVVYTTYTSKHLDTHSHTRPLCSVCV